MEFCIVAVAGKADKEQIKGQSESSHSSEEKLEGDEMTMIGVRGRSKTRTALLGRPLTGVLNDGEQSTGRQGIGKCKGPRACRRAQGWPVGPDPRE